MGRVVTYATLGLVVAACGTPDLPVLPPKKPVLQCGDVIPDPHLPPFRAIERLATTEDEIRILVYGQSISEQTWWLDVRDWLLRQYPRGKLVMTEHARGGCPSQCLIGREAWFEDGRAENRLLEDVFAFRPDLVIFQVFGRHDDYARIVRGLQSGCQALADHESESARCPGSGLFADYRAPEILLQTYHPRDDRPALASIPFEPTVPADRWDEWMARVWIPHVGELLNVPVLDVWHPFRDYLAAHHLPARALLEDDVHLNEPGNALLAALTERALCVPGSQKPGGKSSD